MLYLRGGWGSTMTADERESILRRLTGASLALQMLADQAMSPERQRHIASLGLESLRRLTHALIGESTLRRESDGGQAG